MCNELSPWSDSALVKGTFSTPVVPSWRKYESQMRSGDAHASFDAAEKFTQVRDHALKTDTNMAKWEKSRRESLQKDKPAWRKKEIARLKEKGL